MEVCLDYFCCGTPAEELLNPKHVFVSLFPYSLLIFISFLIKFLLNFQLNMEFRIDDNK